MIIGISDNERKKGRRERAAKETRREGGREGGEKDAGIKEERKK